MGKTGNTAGGLNTKGMEKNNNRVLTPEEMAVKRRLLRWPMTGLVLALVGIAAWLYFHNLENFESWPMMTLLGGSLLIALISLMGLFWAIAAFQEWMAETEED